MPTKKKDKEEAMSKANPAKAVFLKLFGDYCAEKGCSSRDVFLEIKKQKDVFHICEATFYNSISEANTTLSEKVVITFCHLAGIDINQIYYGKAEIEENNRETSTFSVFKHSSAYKPLEDEKFFGKFYGYIYNSIYKSIDSFTLNIEKQPDGVPLATLKMYSKERDGNGIWDVVERQLTGKPMHLHPDLVYIHFQEDEGDETFTFAYKYFTINHAKKLSCRDGALITQCRMQNRFPLIQSFVFFDRKIREEHLHFIEGYLKLSENKLFIPDDALRKLRSENEAVDSLLTRCPVGTKECTGISATLLEQAAIEENIDYDTVAEVICRLKEISVNPEIIPFRDNKMFSKYLSSLCE